MKALKGKTKAVLNYHVNHATFRIRGGRVIAIVLS
jgi:hypothetical protein